MIKISKTSHYAIHVLFCMKKYNKQDYMSCRYISNISNLPYASTSKVLKLLTKADIIGSVAGSKGGYYIKNNFNEIPLYDILIHTQALQTQKSSMCSSDNPRQCKIHNICNLKDNWYSLEKTIVNVFKNIKIRDMQHGLKKYN